MKILALITARGGSKSLPKKNISIVAGKPMIAWTIEAALQTTMIDRVVVSTDDSEIIEISASWGADVPFVRPANLAEDDSPHMDVIIHAIEWLGNNQDYFPDYLVLLQPTSPYRNSEDIDNAIQIALRRDADGVVSVNETHDHPYIAKQISKSGTLVDFVDKPKGYLRRQSFPPAYVLNGAIYIGRRNMLIQKRTFYTEHTFAYIMPPERSLDIDTPWDLYLANLVLQDQLSK